MAVLKLRFAEIHAPLFLMGDKGTNLGTKLDPAKRKGLTLEYDREEKELLVTFDNMEAIIPVTNVATMIPETKETKKVAAKAEAAAKLDLATQAERATRPAVNAQVSGPQMHVHAGPGAGQTGQDDPAKRGPGRPPKQ